MSQQFSQGGIPDSGAASGLQGESDREVAHMQVASSDVRKSRLATAVQQEVARGGRVESQADYSAVIRYGKPVNHVLHLILTLVTFGLWVVVWIIAAIVAASSNMAITLMADEYGQILRQEV